MERAASFIDVFAVGRNMNKCRLDAELAEEFRSFGCGGAIGAIHKNAQVAEIGLYAFGERLDIGVAQLTFTRK